MPTTYGEAWPNRVVKHLFDKAKEISELDEGESVEQQALVAAFEREDAPVSVEALREWGLTLTDEVYAPFVALLREDAVGNEQSGTPENLD